MLCGEAAFGAASVRPHHTAYEATPRSSASRAQPTLKWSQLTQLSFAGFGAWCVFHHGGGDGGGGCGWGGGQGLPLGGGGGGGAGGLGGGGGGGAGCGDGGGLGGGGGLGAGGGLGCGGGGLFQRHGGGGSTIAPVAAVVSATLQRAVPT